MPSSDGAEDTVSYEALYNTPDPALCDAYRVVSRQVKAQKERDGFIAHRAKALRLMLATTPYGRIDAIWSPAKSVAVGAELVAWVANTAADADQALAEAIFSEPARKALIEKFSDAYAEAEADAKPESAWED